MTLLVYQSLFVGALAAVTNWVGVKASRVDEASIVGNMQYMQQIYAAIPGFVQFNEVPDIYTIFGIATIIGSSIYKFHHEALSKEKSWINPGGGLRRTKSDNIVVSNTGLAPANKRSVRTIK